MKVILQQERVAQEIRQFLTSSTPPYLAGKPFWGDNRGRDVAGELRALDPMTATVDQVNEIIGREMLGPLTCTECGEEVDTLVELGEEPDYESSTAWICPTCLERALAEVANARPPTLD